MNANKADQKITTEVLSKLASRGLRSPCSVAVNTNNGEVTLTGAVQYAHQKSAAVNAVSNIPGVRRVVDNTTVGAKRRV